MITESDAVDQDLIDATNAIEDAYQKKIDEERLAYKYVRTEEEEMEPSISDCECQADPEKDYLLCKFCKGSTALFLRIIFQDLFQENVERFKSIPASKGLVIKPLKIEPLQIPDLKFSVKTLDLGMPCICSMQTLMRNGCECEGK